MAGKLEEVMAKIKGDPKLAARFKADPKGVLAELGVDVSKVKFSKEISEEELDQVAGGAVCVSVGCIVCVSIG